MSSWLIDPVPKPYVRPCIVIPNPEDFRYCGLPSGSHTALDLPICDECFEFIRA